MLTAPSLLVWGEVEDEQGEPRFVLLISDAVCVIHSVHTLRSQHLQVASEVKVFFKVRLQRFGWDAAPTHMQGDVVQRVVGKVERVFIKITVKSSGRDKPYGDLLGQLPQKDVIFGDAVNTPRHSEDLHHFASDAVLGVGFVERRQVGSVYARIHFHFAHKQGHMRQVNFSTCPSQRKSVALWGERELQRHPRQDDERLLRDVEGWAPHQLDLLAVEHFVAAGLEGCPGGGVHGARQISDPKLTG